MSASSGVYPRARRKRFARLAEGAGVTEAAGDSLTADLRLVVGFEVRRRAAPRWGRMFLRAMSAPLRRA